MGKLREWAKLRLKWLTVRIKAAKDLVGEMHPNTDRLLAGELPPLKPKPLNLWRRFQLRKLLGYYRFR